MAININSVYKAVLVVLQQEKRGVLTPVEFNKIAAQAQQEIYTSYFDELNLVLRMPQTSLAYADRMAILDEKIQIFKRNETKTTVLAASALTTTLSNVNELGSVIYLAGGAVAGREVQRIQEQDVYTVNESPLTKPTAFYPVYTYEANVLTFYPNTIPAGANMRVNFLAYPVDPIWGFDIQANLGNYIYNPQNSTNFEIHQSDQPLLVDKILGYAGVMTRDQLALSLATQKEQQINADNQK
jgi:hypothetical protein|tara:strand:+ start:4534 stop:5256 length:723 start_codon:yes stop_codon:yes gene_type:complete